jgi:hypothetical protein
VSATTTKYRLEIRPTKPTGWLRITIWNPVAGHYEKVRLSSKKWHTALRRSSDGKAIFNGDRTAARLNDRTWAHATAAKFRRIGFKTRIVPVEIEKYPNLSGDVDADADVLRALNTAAENARVHIHIASGGRTRAEQEWLYHLYLTGRGNLAAKPGTSRHESGRAVDAYVGVAPVGNVDRVKDAMKKLGFSFPLASEPWHAEKL